MWKIKKNLIYPILKNKINKIPFHSRQYPDLPKIYIQNASLEIAWTKVLNKKQPSIAGKKIIPFLTKKNEGFDINDQEDLIIMKHFLKNKKFKIQKI